MIAALLLFVAFTAKPAVIALIPPPGYISYWRIARKPVDWPFRAATASLPLSAICILRTGRPTHYSAGIDSNFLAFEMGCWALFASYVLVWSLAWILLRVQHLDSVPRPRMLCAVGVIVVAATIMKLLLPMAGRPEF